MFFLKNKQVRYLGAIFVCIILISNIKFANAQNGSQYLRKNVIQQNQDDFINEVQESQKISKKNAPLVFPDSIVQSQTLTKQEQDVQQEEDGSQVTGQVEKEQVQSSKNEAEVFDSSQLDILNNLSSDSEPSQHLRIESDSKETQVLETQENEVQEQQQQQDESQIPDTKQESNQSQQQQQDQQIQPQSETTQVSQKEEQIEQKDNQVLEELKQIEDVQNESKGEEIEKGENFLIDEQEEQNKEELVDEKSEIVQQDQENQEVKENLQNIKNEEIEDENQQENIKEQKLESNESEEKKELNEQIKAEDSKEKDSQAEEKSQENKNKVQEDQVKEEQISSQQEGEQQEEQNKVKKEGEEKVNEKAEVEPETLQGENTQNISENKEEANQQIPETIQKENGEEQIQQEAIQNKTQENQDEKNVQQENIYNLDVDDQIEEVFDQVVHQKSDYLASSKMEKSEKLQYQQKGDDANYAVQILCQVFEYNILTVDNWFEIGLKHDHRQEFSKLMEQMYALFPSANLVAAFKENGDICIGSNEISEKVHLETVLSSLTGHSIVDFELQPRLIALEDQINLKFFQVRVSFEQNPLDRSVKLFYQDAELIINGDFKQNILDGETKKMELSVKTIVFLQQGLSMLYFGEMNFNGHQSYIHFNHDILSRAVSSLVELHLELFQNQSLNQFVNQVYGEISAFQIADSIKIQRGIQNLENLLLQEVIFFIDRENNSYQIQIQLQPIEQFSISSQISLYSCTNHVLLNSEEPVLLEIKPDQSQNNTSNNTQNNNNTTSTLANSFAQVQKKINLQLLSITCQIKEFPEFTQILISKDLREENFIISVQKPDYLVSSLFNDILQKLYSGDLDFVKEQFFSIFPKFITRLNEIKIKINFEPSISYGLLADVKIQDWISPGLLNLLSINLNDKQQTLIELKFNGEPLNSFLKEKLRSPLPQNLIPLSTLIFFSSLDVNLQDEHNFVIENFGPVNISTWNKGWFIQHEFSFQEDCFDSKICALLKAKSLQTQNLVLQGFIQNTNLVLKAPLDQFALSKDLNLYDSFLILSINPVLFNQQIQYDPKQIPLVNQFQIEGKFNLNISETYFLTLCANIFENEVSEVIILTDSNSKWENAFDQTFINFNQIMIKGYFEDFTTYSLSYFTIMSLGIFGKECFYETFSRVEFQKDICFFGNSYIKIDFDDFSKNFFQAYIQKLNMIQILSTLMGAETKTIYEKVSKTILNTQFIQGVQLSYSQKNILNDDASTVKIPQGITIQGTAFLAGLKGRIVLNIDQQKQIMIGVFHFQTVVLAGGNLILFEDSIIESNNIILKLHESIEKSQQVFIQVTGTLFDLTQQLRFQVDEVQEIFLLDTEDFYFNSKYPLKLELKSEPQQAKKALLDQQKQQSLSLGDSQFDLKCVFSQNHTLDIQNSLIQQTKEWFNSVEKELEQIEEYLNQIYEIRNTLFEKVCDKLNCPQQLQCLDEPQKKCSKYKQKQICDKKESICLDVSEKCTQTEIICQEFEDICVEWETANLSENDEIAQCKRYETQCKQSIEICLKYTNVCNSEQIQTCSQYSFVDDLDSCELFHFGCELKMDYDQSCWSECEKREQQFQYYDLLYTSIFDLYAKFQDKNLKFNEMMNQVKDGLDFLKIYTASFTKKLTQPVTSLDFNVQFEIQTFQEFETQTLIVENYDFENLDKSNKRLFNLVQEKWIEKFKIDPILIKGESSSLVQYIFHQSLNENSSQNFNQQDFLLIQKSQNFLNKIYKSEIEQIY